MAKLQVTWREGGRPVFVVEATEYNVLEQFIHFIVEKKTVAIVRTEDVLFVRPVDGQD